jgi:hypothetical protein
MRVSGRRLRLAVGTGIAALTLMLGVSSVGATAPGTVGNVNVVVTSAGASGIGLPSTNTTAANYRDAVVITNVLSGAGGLAGNYDGCLYNEVGNQNNNGTVTNPAGNRSSTDIAPFTCGLTNPIIQPAAYPLWEVQGGSSTPVLVVPPTPGNRVAPAKSYVIESFR